MNKKIFYDKIRPLFGGKLAQSQVDGMEALITGTGFSKKQLAYTLATAFHETAKTMQPISEYGQKSYFDKYEPGTKLGKQLGNTKKGDGYKFRGRGFVMLTGRANYEYAGRATGMDTLNNPDQVMELGAALEITTRGMKEGWFTGKKLDDYINKEKTDYVNARKIINGLDKAQMIADYAFMFEQALTAAGS